jgi:hypothetical protein
MSLERDRYANQLGRKNWIFKYYLDELQQIIEGRGERAEFYGPPLIHTYIDELQASWICTSTPPYALMV